MRLINTYTGMFDEFIGNQMPEYAILSHTWEEEEVSYKDIIEGRHKEKKGFKKIEMTCKIAAGQGIQWVWVDTCCKCSNRVARHVLSLLSSQFRLCFYWLTLTS